MVAFAAAPLAEASWFTSPAIDALLALELRGGVFFAPNRVTVGKWHLASSISLRTVNEGFHRACYNQDANKHLNYA